MADYIISIDVNDIKESSINSEIYEFRKEEHDELIKSIELNGLLEPLVIDKDNNLISGHRRLSAIKEIGWENVDCRITHTDNLLISLIELNRYRKKTESELTKEAGLLMKEYNILRGSGKSRQKQTQGKNWSIVDVSKKLGTNTTKLKKLLSIENYEPTLLNEIDLGKISVEKAYQKVRKDYIIPKRGSDEKSYDRLYFKSSFEQLLDKYLPTKKELLEIYNSVKKK